MIHYFIESKVIKCVNEIWICCGWRYFLGNLSLQIIRSRFDGDALVVEVCANNGDGR